MVRFVRRTLELQDYQVVVSADGQSALDQFEKAEPDLVILDVGIPKLDGLEVCRYLRTYSQVPVIIVSGRDQDEDVIKGFEAGADAYLCKPFSARLLLARVNALIRRRFAQFEPQINQFDSGDLVVDFVARRVTLAGETTHLTPIQYRLLSFLARHCGRVLTSRRILIEVWGGEPGAKSQVLRTHIARLRKKIEPNPEQPTIIRTQPGVGYWIAC